MAESKYTAIRKWFAAAVELGEFIGIRYGHLPTGEREPRWLFYSHMDCDGIGAFAEILRSRGVELKSLPQIKYYPAYSAVVAALKHWPRYLAPRRPLNWSGLESDPVGANNPAPPTAVAWHVFDETTTFRIRYDSRKMGVTVNTFLLDKLDKAIRPSLENPQAGIPWMVPVNMRGGASQHRDTDNHSSYVVVRIHQAEPAIEVHRRLLRTLSRGEHWGNWHALGLGNFLTNRMRALVVASGRGTSQWTLGTFSNLGEWDPDDEIRSQSMAGDWLFCPPALRIQKLAGGCVTFQGRLSLTLQAHPELTNRVDVVRAWVKRWVAGIEEPLSKHSLDAAPAYLAARAASVART